MSVVKSLQQPLHTFIIHERIYFQMKTSLKHLFSYMTCLVNFGPHWISSCFASATLHSVIYTPGFWVRADDSELNRNSGIPGTNTMLTPDASVGAIVLFGVKQQHTVDLFSQKTFHQVGSSPSSHVLLRRIRSQVSC